METILKRHGFVTFWLWLEIVINIIAVPYSLMSYQSLKNLGLYGMQLISAGIDINPFVDTIGIYVLIMQATALMGATLLIIGYRKLLNWQKSGFWLNASTAVVSCIINIIMMHFIGQEYLKLGLLLFASRQLVMVAIGVVISILIQWAILQIRKDGVSCWNQLK